MFKKMVIKKQSYYSFSKTRLILIIILGIVSCKEIYNPNIQSPVTGYLVVEGFINSLGETNIRLTRTTKLVDAASIIYEHFANLTIEGENNESYPLFETDSGKYHSNFLNLNNDVKYRLHIQTNDGSDYVSDFSKVKYTPPIDSVSWLRDDKGVHIYVNTHDDINNTKYYQWDFTETWEFHSLNISSLQWVYNERHEPIGVTGRTPAPDTTVYKCWNTVQSSAILLGSTEKLSENKIYLEWRSIEPASIKLSVLYSIIFRQHALSHEAYIFYEKMKKNTEQVGSVFDAQPSDLRGNIHNTNNPAETVVGFVEVSTEEQKRIYIKNSEVPDWNYTQSCISAVIDNVPDSIRKYGPGLEPLVCVSGCPIPLVSFSATQPECVDCRLRGGITTRPDFWP